MKIFLFFLISCIFVSAWAEDNHDLIRRMVVFPIKTEKAFSQAAEEAWWKMRETLTENKRFLVASKNFLQRKDVFQARGELNPADVIILGELLDSHVIITTYLEARKLTLKAYGGRYGRVLWERSVELHPSIPISEQLTRASVNLIQSFIAAIPYHGFVVVDSLIGRPVYEENAKVYIQVDVGINSNVLAGDVMQLIRVYSDNLRPLFIDGATIEIFAEGKVIGVKDGLATAEVVRATSIDQVKQFSLVRFPKELKRLKELYALKNSLKRRIDPEYLSPEITSLTEEKKENKPLIASLTFIINIAAFLLLAF